MIYFFLKIRKYSLFCFEMRKNAAFLSIIFQIGNMKAISCHFCNKLYVKVLRANCLDFFFSENLAKEVYIHQVLRGQLINMLRNAG